MPTILQKDTFKSSNQRIIPKEVAKCFKKNARGYCDQIHDLMQAKYPNVVFNNYSALPLQPHSCSHTYVFRQYEWNMEGE